jgi:hypothetical protein
MHLSIIIASELADLRWLWGDAGKSFSRLLALAIGFALVFEDMRELHRQSSKFSRRFCGNVPVLKTSRVFATSS